jgi:DNA-binding NtrC family response regulator
MKFLAITDRAVNESSSEKFEDVLHIAGTAMILPVADLAKVLITGEKSYRQFMNELERAIFSAAVALDDGRPTRAAHRLGMSHERFIAALKARHPGIERTPIKKRSVMKK